MLPTGPLSKGSSVAETPIVSSMYWKKILGASVLLMLLVAGFAEPAQAFDEHRDGPSMRPIPGAIVRDFDPPAADWLPGHRGVDLLGRAGEPVVAAASGTVVFAGQLAGRSVISIELPSGGRITYEPVAPAVLVGSRVQVGEIIGVLETGHCTVDVADACLHFGVKRGDNYLDPNIVLAQATTQQRRIRLLPAVSVDDVAQRAASRQPPVESGTLGPSGTHRPAEGPITSRYGMRRHPITGVVKLHDGLDIGAACGTPIRALRAGTVEQRRFHPAYGWWLIVDHHDGLRTGYAHAQHWVVSMGETVSAGQILGSVGSTGYSTGCHLHFMAWQHGTLVNPHPLLGEH